VNTRANNEQMPTKTFVAKDGRTLLFSCNEFVEVICKGGACFICGATSEFHDFNDEHIVPRWVLRRYNLFNKQITLPTGELRKYGGYRVPCCRLCNSLLGSHVEEPVSNLLAGDYDEVKIRLESLDAREILFVWLSLLFLKMHLKDSKVPVHKDRRQGSAVIGDIYDWADLHHIHAIARSPYTRAILEPGVLGSMFLVEVDDPTSADGWDFIDLTFAQTIAVRVGRIGIVAVLNDSGGAASAWSHRLSLITGPVTGSQFRELAAMFAVANDDIQERPEFGTLIIREQWAILFARVPTRLEMAEFDSEKFGHTLLFALGNTLPTIEVDGSRDPELVARKIKTGRVRFLWDEEFNFRPADQIVRRTVVE
jgi:hypothetical protein